MLVFSDGLCLFRAFLVSEFSEENIAFYLACEDYKETKSSKQAAKASRIYNEFICADAPREVSMNYSAGLQDPQLAGGRDAASLLLQVNLDHATKAITKENMGEPTEACFDLAQAKIYTLMEKDCYPRFLKSSTYLEVTGKVKSG